MTGVPEAPLERTENGVQAAGEGWFVVNARDAVWGESETMGVFTRLGESKAARFPQLGFNIGVLWPGQPACMYHREPNQEGFLIVSGECVLLVEGQERHMKTWDYFHCPADTDHLRTVARVTSAWREAVANSPARRPDPGLAPVRWMIEELRVSLFAQFLGTPYPVSEKRVLRAIDRAGSEQG